MIERENQTMQKERDGAAVRIFPPGVPLLAILAGVALDRLWPLDLAPFLPPPLRLGLGWGIVAAAVLGLGIWPAVLFRRGGQSPTPWTRTPRLETRGPYRLTRNPMYLHLVLICCGVGIVLANGWVLLLTPVVGWVLQRWAILPEEEYLERKFGDEYRAYKRRVRRWL